MNATEALKILEIEKKFPIDEDLIKKQYRTKAKENHPDIIGNDEQMKKINDAYDWLSKNLEMVNKANLKQPDKKTNNNYKHFETLDKVIQHFLQWYPIQPNIEKRKVMVDGLLQAIEEYKFEDKIKKFKDSKF